MPKSVTLKGNPLDLAGTEVKVGDKLPAAKLSKSLVDDVSLADYAGKTVVLVVVPSLDTPVCDIEAQRFNKEAASLGSNVAVLVISRDLPSAQARWCGANEAKNIQTLSDYKHRKFAKAFGVEIPALGVTSRAVFVAGPDQVLKYVEYVPEVAQEPNYDAALAAVKA